MKNKELMTEKPKKDDKRPKTSRVIGTLWTSDEFLKYLRKNRENGK